MGKKRKFYFDNSQAAKKAKLKFGNNRKIAPNMKGFLITYNCKFTFCLNEAKKLLQQFAITNNEDEKDQKGQSSNDIEKELQKELDSLNSVDKEFNVIDTGAKYTIFIKQSQVNPNRVVDDIFQYIENTRKPLGRFVQRLVPILNTCKAYLEDIEKCVKATFEELDEIKNANESIHGEEAKSFKYSCIFKTSNNGTLSRDEIFKSVGNYLHSINKKIKVDFDQPDYVIMIHVICNICFIGFLRNYFEYRKYNLIEMGVKVVSDQLVKGNKGSEIAQPPLSLSTAKIENQANDASNQAEKILDSQSTSSS